MEIKKIVEGMTATEVAQVIDDNFKAAEKDKANKTDVNASIAKLTETMETNKTETDAKIDSNKEETDGKLSELGSEVGVLLNGYIHGNGSTKFYSPNDNGKYLTYVQAVTPGDKYIIYMDALPDSGSLAAFTPSEDYLNGTKGKDNLPLKIGYNVVTVPEGSKFLGVTLEFNGEGDRTKKIIAKAPLLGILPKIEDIEENLKSLNLIPNEIEELKAVNALAGDNIFINSGLIRKNGRLVETSDWRYSDFMPITSTNIKMKVQNWASSTLYATVVFYDKNKEVVGYIESEETSFKEVEITKTDIPESAMYYVVSVKATDVKKAYVENWIIDNFQHITQKQKGIEEEVISNSEFKELFKKEEEINSFKNEDGYYRNYGTYYSFVGANGYNASELIPVNVGDVFFVGTSVNSNATSTSCHVTADADGTLIGLLNSNAANITNYKITKQMYDSGVRFVGFSFKSSDKKTITKSYYNINGSESKDENNSISLYDRITVNDVYRGLASSAIKNKLLIMDKDIDIVLDGDSLTAFTNIGEEMTNAANLPAGCQRNCITYMLWDALCKNKQQCDRFDSSINAFTESGSFTLSSVEKQNTSGNSGGEKGEYSPDNCVYRECSTNGAYVQFNWNVTDYEKLNFIYRMGYDGTTQATVQCTSGVIEVYDRNTKTWVEASGFTFSMYKIPGSKMDGTADWLRNLPLKFRRKSSAVGSITIKIVNTGSGVMYYWGTERWNFNTVRVTNIARGGRHIELLQGVLNDEVNYRDIDYFILQLPIWNEMKSGGDYNSQWDKRHTAFIDKLKELSNNFTDFQLAVTIYHTQVQCWDGNKSLIFYANGDTSRTPTDEPEYIGLMKTYKAMKEYANEDKNIAVLPLVVDVYNFAQTVGITMEQMLSSEVGGGIGDGTSIESGEVYDKFTVDGAHCSNAGFKFYNTLIRSIFI